MSGLGKGITTSSVAKLLQLSGVSVSCLKIDPYLNFDAGTMNPITHGEVFVTDDGGETDMDLGTYERFLNQNLSRESNITTGQVYKKVIEDERKGRFLGKSVQIIPHITDEIKRRVRGLAEATGVDVLVIECGGGSVSRASAFHVLTPATAPSLPGRPKELDILPLTWEVFDSIGKRTRWPEPDGYSDLLDTMLATRGAPFPERVSQLESSGDLLKVRSLTGEEVPTTRHQLRAIVSIYS
jgi:hypothetical protein